MRVGYIIARDQKAYGQWARRSTRKSNSLTGAELESAVMALASAHPEYVVVGP